MLARASLLVVGVRVPIPSFSNVVVLITAISTAAFSVDVSVFLLVVHKAAHQVGAEEQDGEDPAENGDH